MFSPTLDRPDLAAYSAAILHVSLHTQHVNSRPRQFEHPLHSGLLFRRLALLLGWGGLPKPREVCYRTYVQCRT